MEKNFSKGIGGAATAIFVVGVIGILIIFLYPVIVGGLQLLRNCFV